MFRRVAGSDRAYTAAISAGSCGGPDVRRREEPDSPVHSRHRFGRGDATLDVPPLWHHVIERQYGLLRER